MVFGGPGVTDTEQDIQNHCLICTYAEHAQNTLPEPKISHALITTFQRMAITSTFVWFEWGGTIILQVHALITTTFLRMAMKSTLVPIIF